MVRKRSRTSHNRRKRAFRGQKTELNVTQWAPACPSRSENKAERHAK
ncbi:MAG: hypothetical protein U5K84_06065 [Alkalibacterium sp.]|nr:hypothetical protein [Alkalibacterium sp.]